MVLITDDRDGGGASSVRLKQLQHQHKVGPNTPQVHSTIAEESQSNSEEDDDDDGDGDEEEEDDNGFEEVDFEDLGDCRSILSDDSFYPPDDAFADSERSPSPQSPEPLSFFRACCTNNAAVVRLMIRHGVKQDEVNETDRNNRVGGPCSVHDVGVPYIMHVVDIQWKEVTVGHWPDLLRASPPSDSSSFRRHYSVFCSKENCKSTLNGHFKRTKTSLQTRLNCAKFNMVLTAHTALLFLFYGYKG